MTLWRCLFNRLASFDMRLCSGDGSHALLHGRRFPHLSPPRRHYGPIRKTSQLSNDERFHRRSAWLYSRRGPTSAPGNIVFPTRDLSPLRHPKQTPQPDSHPVQPRPRRYRLEVLDQPLVVPRVPPRRQQPTARAALWTEGIPPEEGVVEEGGDGADLLLPLGGRRGGGGGRGRC